ncbi:MAG TPA: thioredoxin family protein, partial [Magnetospirillaceae bacterium]|nr:thioredoxin family protein [Magnetospirillaceae bacterium]
DTVISWPAPHRFSISGLETMGYKAHVILPLVARVNDPAQPLILRAAVDYLTCAVVCVPQHADLSMALPSGPSTATPHSHEIGKFLAAVPSDGPRVGLSLVSAEATESGELVVTVTANPALKDPDLFIERADQMQFTRPRVQLSQGGKKAVFRAKPLEGTGEAGLTDKTVTLTVVDGDRGMEVATDLAPPQPGIRFPRLLAMLGVALLGGLILNLMPCVLPVLSLKILALIGHGGGEKREVRSSFLATAAGIVVSFLALAAMTSVVKLAGSAVGWGVQFQQPVFLGIMIGLITLFAANLFGWFEIPLPQFLADIGANSGPSHGWAGHFATGAFATLLATPCSAPFLGTAVGFALAHGMIEIFSIFLLLGLGMAAPYLAVAAWPQLAQKLPRPGNWMITARKILGLALLATGIWLLSVLVIVMGLQTGLAVAAAMALALLLLALAHRFPAIPRGVVMVATIAAAIGLPMIGDAPSGEDRHAAAKGLWKPFDQAAVAAEVTAGHVVFVDVTAEWCLTCQVNKATVVYRGEVSKRLHAPGIVAMQADWTRPDETIANYLASFGRYGIPFDAVYGPGAPNGVVLPELLTDDAVLQALDQAAGKPAS